MTDRDTFAAAALAGLLAGGLRSSTLLALDAYKVADEMLRQRDRHIPDAGKKAETTSRTVPDAWATAYAVTRACEIANHDAVPEARAACEDRQPQAAASLGNQAMASNAGCTGDTPEPVAWAVAGVGYEYVSLLRESAAEAARSGGGVMVPLYRRPQPTLTDAEREAVDMAIDLLNGVEDVSAGASSRADAAAATLRGLLERTK